MSRAVPDLPIQGADAPDLLPPSQPGWLQRNRHLIGLGLSLLLFGVALLACWHLVREINPDQVRDSLAAVPPQALLGALLATVLGFVVMLAYEWSASRYANVHLPPPILALGGFCAFAIGNAIGLSALSGGSVRYRLYGRSGLGAGDVARMSLFASLSLGVSLPILAALAALFDLEDAAAALRLPQPLLAVLAVAVLVGALALVLLVSRKRLAERPAPGCWQVDFGRFSLRLPGAGMSLTQLLISSLDVLIAASALYLLLPDAPPFSSFVLIYMLALAAGVLSHVPGGVGVFEAVLLAAFSSRIDPAGLVAAMLLYRLLYVVLPLVTAGLLLLAEWPNPSQLVGLALISGAVVLVAQRPGMAPAPGGALAASQRQGLLLILAALVCGSAGAVLARQALAAAPVSGWQAAGVRLAAATMVQMPLLPGLLRGAWGGVGPAPARPRWPLVLLATLLGTTLRISLQQSALALLPAGQAVTLMATAPTMAALLAPLDGDHPGRRGWLAALLALLGVLLVV